MEKFRRPSESSTELERILEVDERFSFETFEREIIPFVCSVKLFLCRRKNFFSYFLQREKEREREGRKERRSEQNCRNGQAEAVGGAASRRT